MKMNRFNSRVKALGGDILAAKPFSRKQAIFNEKAQQYAGQGVITTPGYLRLETLLQSGIAGTSLSSISFNTLDTSGIKQPTERRLKLSDTFTITGMSFYLGTGASAVVGTPTAIEQAKENLLTFPNPNYLTIAGMSDELESLYNGFLSLRVDTTTFLDSVPLKQFYRVGTSQKGVGSTAVGNLPVQADEWNSSMYGSTQLLPTIELNGQANIEWSITLPTSMPYVQPAGFTNAVIVLDGFLNQGAATVQRNVQRRLR
jgi:hypothetical protein